MLSGIKNLRLSSSMITVWVNRDARFTNVLLYNAEFEMRTDRSQMVPSA